MCEPRVAQKRTIVLRLKQPRQETWPFVEYNNSVILFLPLFQGKALYNQFIYICIYLYIENESLHSLSAFFTLVITYFTSPIMTPCDTFLNKRFPAFHISSCHKEKSLKYDLVFTSLLTEKWQLAKIDCSMFGYASNPYE